MTKNQARNAIIAMRLGWTKCVCGDPECGAWFAPGASKDEPSLGPPDYSEDLNVMAKAEATLPDDNSLHGLVVYHNKLLAICGSHKACVSATAEQRAEAFLKTIDRWKP